MLSTLQHQLGSTSMDLYNTKLVTVLKYRTCQASKHSSKTFETQNFIKIQQMGRQFNSISLIAQKSLWSSVIEGSYNTEELEASCRLVSSKLFSLSRISLLSRSAILELFSLPCANLRLRVSLNILAMQLSRKIRYFETDSTS